MGTLSAASVPVPALRSPTVTDPPPPAAALTWRAFAPAGQVTGEVRATPDAPAASVASVVRRLAPGQPTAIQLQVVARQPCRLLTAVEAQPEPSDLSGASNRLPVPRLRAEHVEPDFVPAHDVPADRVDDATRPGRTVGYALEGVHRQPAAAARDPRPTENIRQICQNTAKYPSNFPKLQSKIRTDGRRPLGASRWRRGFRRCRTSASRRGCG